MMEKKRKDIISILMLIGTIAYVIGIIWVNFNGRQWYTFDIYSDTIVAKLMAEQKTLFPTNWVFGNQFYVIATPVLSSIIYSICHNSILAMAISSTVMTILVISCFIWSIKPFVSAKGIIVGTFCVSGAVILGSSAASYVNGFSYFYTMASFYSCYVLVFFFTVGIFFRFSEKKNVSFLLVIISMLFSFALGMQSLRGTLVIYLPLVTYEILILISKKEKWGGENTICYNVVYC